jgi:hypothetical protein
MALSSKGTAIAWFAPLAWLQLNGVVFCLPLASVVSSVASPMRGTSRSECANR